MEQNKGEEWDGRVLVLEDSEDTVLLLRVILEKIFSQERIDVSENFSHALRIAYGNLSSEKPFIALCDGQVPGFSDGSAVSEEHGISFMEFLLDNGVGSSHIICISGHEDVLTWAKERGITRFPKPIHFGELRTKILKIIGSENI